MAVMIPAVTKGSIVTRSDLDLDDYANTLDGLVLQGGNDVAPETYGETPLHPDWAGDRVRDRYEIELIDAFVRAGKPVFGICRGLQLLNVMFGGTLLQDIATQRPASRAHRDGSAFERHFHGIELVKGSRLAQLYPGVQNHRELAATRRSRTRSRLCGRGVLSGRRHDRSSAPFRPFLRGRGAMAPGVPYSGRPGEFRRCAVAARPLERRARHAQGARHGVAASRTHRCPH
jgi:hypothetical protein